MANNAITTALINGIDSAQAEGHRLRVLQPGQGRAHLYNEGLDPVRTSNTAMVTELTLPGRILLVSLPSRRHILAGAQSGYPGSDLLFVYLWDYNTGSYLVGGSMNGTTDQVVSFSVTANPGDYVQAADGQMTVFVVNEDTSDWIRIAVDVTS